MAGVTATGRGGRPDDAALMAFADGALNPEGMREVEAALARDPEARATVERFRATRGLLLDAFSEEPVPELLERRVRAMAGRRRRAAAVQPVRRWALPLAAGVALAVGLAAGWAAGRHGLDPLAAALEATPSGTSVTLADGRALTPTATFKDAAGRWCRAFAQAGATGAACRETGGAWRLAYLVPAAPAGEAYAPAGEEAELGEALLARLGAGEPVDAAAERALIEAGWR
jgi:hypothetical protein